MHDELNELLPLHALGALDGDDRARLETHLASGCAECVEQLAALDRVAASLAWAASPAVPPAGLRDRVLAAVAAEARAPEVIPFGPRAEPAAPPARGTAFVAIASLLAAAAVAIVFLTTMLVWNRSALDEAARQFAALQKETRETNAELERANRVLEVVNDPGVRITRLASTAAPSEPGIDVLWNPAKKRGVLYARSLPKAEPGKDYELWLIAENAPPIPAAVFDTDADGNAVVAIDELPVTAAPKAFAITVEPKGGSPTPTLPIRFAGNFAGA